MSKKKVVNQGLGHTLDRSAKEGVQVSREQVREWICRDLGGIYFLFVEMLNSQEVIDKLTDVFYAKYEAMMKSKEMQPELFENGREQ